MLQVPLRARQVLQQRLWQWLCESRAELCSSDVCRPSPDVCGSGPHVCRSCPDLCRGPWLRREGRLQWRLQEWLPQRLPRPLQPWLLARPPVLVQQVLQQRLRQWLCEGRPELSREGPDLRRGSELRSEGRLQRRLP
jgi:hypothetical protein